MTPSIALVPGVAQRLTQQTRTFPSVTLPTRPGRVPIEVNLVARLGHGAGTRMFFDVLARQKRHVRFVDALDEPSAKLGNTDFENGDPTALYSFSVGHGGHPFHRHAGHRVFTAVSGSGGAQLRFSTATPAEIELDPTRFVQALHYVDVPPDCMFTVRFSGETWHQFAPLVSGSGHPAFFALSTHTNELGGELDDVLRERVMADQGDIPSLTQLLPSAVQQLLEDSPPRREYVPTTALSLHDKPGSLLETACGHVRSMLGHIYRLRTQLKSRPGFVTATRPTLIRTDHDLAAHSLLREELCDRTIHHQDSLTATLRAKPSSIWSAEDWLMALLDGFLDNRPRGVSRLMSLRNVLVKPLHLRTSPIGCPVSSLLGPRTHGPLFAGRFPVRALRLGDDLRSAQVVLGADDKHLVFRSCVGVRILESGDVEFSLATRVACKNTFGRVYMALIAATHREYVAPTMLAYATEFAQARRNQ